MKIRFKNFPVNIYNYLDSWILHVPHLFNTTGIIQDDLLIAQMSIAGWDVNE
jgi:hypothetical protein